MELDPAGNSDIKLIRPCLLQQSKGEQGLNGMLR